MGLPYYRNPEEVDQENAAAKLDRAAAQRRSTIRREATLRPGRDQSSFSGLTNIIRNRHELSRARIQASYERQEADAQIMVLEQELDRLRQLRQRNARRLQEEQAQAQHRLEREIENGLHSTRDSPTDTDSRMATTSGNESTRYSLSTHDQVTLPRPARESNLRFHVAADSSTRPTSPRSQPSFMPSPPHSLSDTSRGRPVDGPLEPWETHPPLTQDFAPARAVRAIQDSTSSTTDIHTGAARRSNDDDGNSLETPPPESWESSYPPLRRVPHMSPRPLPRNIVDGLGDRRRSPSPSSEGREEETWNNLLTTLDNSHNAPSTSTSFASMTDLLSTSRSSSHRSANTQNTSASFGEIGTSSEDVCDPPPGITEDDVRQIRERHRRTAGRVTAPRRYLVDPEYDDSVQDSGSRSRSMHSPVSILLDEARRLRESRFRETRRSGDELSMLQAIAERQQSHEQVPDEWWALAGLPSALGRQRDDL